MAEPDGECDPKMPALKKTSSKFRHGVGVIEIRQHALKDSFETQNENEKKENGFVHSEVYHMYQSYPFGFRTPEFCTTGVCRWIYPITFGGGMVGGDQMDGKYIIGDRCSVLVCTQDITKVYHCLHSDETRQALDYALHQNCLLCVLPDSLVCYKDAKFSQQQTFHLEPSSNLVLLDWLQAGRKALGESWQFERYCSSIDIFFSGKLVLHERNELEASSFDTLENCMWKFQVMGTCIILGPYVASLAQAMQDKYGRKKGFGEKNPTDLVVSVSSLSYLVKGDKIDGCYLRFLAVDMNAASVFVKDLTKPLIADLGADPFENKL